jgi:hypothetical protein
MRDEDTPAELEQQQEAKERAERERASNADEESEAAAHLRRADKAAYLRDKLSEQEHADREGGV